MLLFWCLCIYISVHSVLGLVAFRWEWVSFSIERSDSVSNDFSVRAQDLIVCCFFFLHWFVVQFLVCLYVIWIFFWLLCFVLLWYILLFFLPSFSFNVRRFSNIFGYNLFSSYIVQVLSVRCDLFIYILYPTLFGLFNRRIVFYTIDKTCLHLVKVSLFFEYTTQTWIVCSDRFTFDKCYFWYEICWISNDSMNVIVI